MCYNGGFSIGTIFRDMVNKSETTRHDSEMCQGYEGSPKGKNRYQSCLHRFHYRVNIIYKTKPPESKNDEL